MKDYDNHTEAFVRKYGSYVHYTEYFQTVGSSPEDVGQCYLEAFTLQQFEMGVTLAPHFNFKECSHVKITFSIDGGAELCTSIVEVPAHRQKPLPILASTRLVPIRGGGWEVYGFKFGRLVEDKNLHITMAQQDYEVDKRGKIVITMQRGSSNAKPVQDIIPSDSRSHVVPLHTTPYVIECGRTHALTLVTLHKVTHGPHTVDTFLPAEGEAGQARNFTFLYVSPKQLNRMGANLARPTSGPPQTSSLGKRQRPDEETSPRQELKEEISPPPGISGGDKEREEELLLLRLEEIQSQMRLLELRGADVA